MKRVLLTCSCLALLAVPALAQEPAAGAPATVVMRSGERISAEVIDLANQGLLVRVNGNQRWIPPADVVAIDFAGDGRSSAGAGGQPRVLLRDGQTIDGRLSDIGGVQPKILYVETPSGLRQFSSAEVALVVLSGEGPRQVQQAQEAAVGTVGRRDSTSFSVPANQRWTETDIIVRQGETLQLRVDGEIAYAPNQRTGAAGVGRGTRGANTPLPNAPAGALIGRIDNGEPFLVGRQTSVRMPANGRLFLGINDDVVEDNSGEFQVIVAPAGGGARRR